MSPTPDNITIARDRVTKLLIGTDVVNVDPTGTTDNGTFHSFDALLTSDVTTGMAVYEVNSNVCFTPPGDNSISNYMTDFSTFSGTLPARHRCY